MNFEFWKKGKVSKVEAGPTEMEKLDVLIADIKARIDNGSHTPDDGRLLTKYEAERALLK